LKSLPNKKNNTRFQSTVAWREFNNYVASETLNAHSTGKRLYESRNPPNGPHNKLFEMLLMQISGHASCSRDQVPLDGPGSSHPSALDLCSGSGGFVKVLLSQGFAVDAMDSDKALLKSFSTSLAEGVLRMIPPTRFSLRPLETAPIDFLDDALLLSRKLGLYHLVTCDGFDIGNPGEPVDYTIDGVWKAQKSLFLAQLLLAFMCVAKGGTIVIKFFHCLNDFDKGVVSTFVAAVSIYFRYFGVVKPPSSDIVNYERYMVFKDFNPCGAHRVVSKGVASDEHYAPYAEEMCDEARAADTDKKVYRKSSLYEVFQYMSLGCMLNNRSCGCVGSGCSYSVRYVWNLCSFLSTYDRVVKRKRQVVLFHYLKRYVIQRTTRQSPVQRERGKPRSAASSRADSATIPFPRKSREIVAMMDTLYLKSYKMSASEAYVTDICPKCRVKPTVFPTQYAKVEYEEISRICPDCMAKILME